MNDKRRSATLHIVGDHPAAPVPPTSERDERANLRRALSRSEAKLRSLYESEIIGIMVADHEGAVKEANDAFLRMIGYSRTEMERGLVRWDDLTPSDWRSRDAIASEEFEQSRKIEPYEKEFTRRDGSRVPVMIGAAGLADSAEAICFVVDNSGSKKVEQLRSLALHLDGVLEKERARLAREIHDVLGQEMTGLKMDVAWIARRLLDRSANAEAIAGRIDSMLLQIDSTITAIRRISSDLRPSALDDLGLVAAIEGFARDFEARSGIAVRFVAPVDEISVGAQRATALFRIFQELLTNVARHAGARRIDASLSFEPAAVVLEVEDDGRGIQHAEANSSTSLGLLGIRERALVFGGELSVDGSRGRGTRARVRLPLTSRLSNLS